MKIPPYLFFPMFVFMWIAVSFILSRLGWIHLVRKYGSNEEFKGKRIGALIGRVNGISYRNVAILYYNESELYFKAHLLLRLFHAPFKVPLKKFVFTVRKGKYYYLELDDVSDLAFRLDRKQGLELTGFLKSNGLENLIRYE